MIIIQESAFEQKKKTELKFNSGFTLVGLWTTGRSFLH